MPVDGITRPKTASPVKLNSVSAVGQEKKAVRKSIDRKRLQTWSLVFFLAVATVFVRQSAASALIGQQGGGSPASRSGGHALRQPAAVTDGLVAYWPLDGGLADMTANHNDGTASGSPAWVGGKFGKALSFNGSGDGVSVSSPTAIPIGSSAFSVSLWVNPAVLDTSRAPLSWGTDSTDADFVPTILSDGKICIDRFADQVLTSSDSIRANQWSHVAITYTGSTLSIYINGKSSASTTITLTTGSITGMDLGRVNSVSYPEYFEGSLDDVRIYSRAISSTDVNRLYQGSSPVNCDQSCLGWWKLDESGGHPGSDATNVNGAGFTSGHFGGAYSFNGTSTYLQASNAETSPTSALTVSVWVYLNSTSGVQGIVNNRKDMGFVMEENNGTVNIFVRTSGAGSYVGSPGYTISAGQWVHLVGVYDGSDVRLYANGSEIGTGTATSGSIQYDASTHIYLGAEDSNLSSLYRFLDGDEDDVRIYNRALSAGEVAQLYNGTEFSVLDSSLMAWWRLNEVSGTTATDSSNFAADSTGRGNLSLLSGFTFDNTTNGWTEGQFKGGLKFNGSTTEIPLPNLGLWGAEPFSVSFWTNPAASSAIEEPFSFSGAELVRNYPSVGDFSFFPYPNSVSIPLTVPFPSSGSWHQVVFVSDASHISFYIDGVRAGTATYAASSNNSNYAIGHSGNQGTYYYSGSLDDFRVYNRALADYEINDQYLAGRSL